MIAFYALCQDLNNRETMYSILESVYLISEWPRLNNTLNRAFKNTINDGRNHVLNTIQCNIYILVLQTAPL